MESRGDLWGSLLNIYSMPYYEDILCEPYFRTPLVFEKYVRFIRKITKTKAQSIQWIQYNSFNHSMLALYLYHVTYVIKHSTEICIVLTAAVKNHVS